MYIIHGINVDKIKQLKPWIRDLNLYIFTLRIHLSYIVLTKFKQWVTSSNPVGDFKFLPFQKLLNLIFGWNNVKFQNSKLVKVLWLLCTFIYINIDKWPIPPWNYRMSCVDIFFITEDNIHVLFNYDFWLFDAYSEKKRFLSFIRHQAYANIW